MKTISKIEIDNSGGTLKVYVDGERLDLAGVKRVNICADIENHCVTVEENRTRLHMIDFALRSKYDE